MREKSLFQGGQQRQPQLVQRAHLLERLGDERQRPLALVAQENDAHPMLGTCYITLADLLREQNDRPAALLCRSAQK